MTDRARRVVGFFRSAQARPVLSGTSYAADLGLAAIVTIAALVAAIEGYLPVGGHAHPSPNLVGGPPAPLAHLIAAPSWVLLGAVLATAPLAFRRTYPTSAFYVILAAVIVTSHYSTAITVGSAIFAAYCSVVYSRNRRAALLSLIAGAVIITLADPQAAPQVPERYTALLILVPTVAAGYMMRVWQQRAGDSAARLHRAEAGHEADTRQAVDLERARIASELHDVVTHNVSIMVIQAGAARRVLDGSPDDAREALLAVETSGRTAMTELRHLLGLLAPPGDQEASAGPEAGTDADGDADADVGGAGDATLSPQPGVAQILALLARVGAAGLPVELSVVGPARARVLPPGIDLAAFRVVQEALTNVMKHAGQARSVVTIEYRPGELRISVCDDGRPADAPVAGPAHGQPPDPGGRGLIGLRERIAIYGGDLAAGPRPGGGWRVSARIPLEPVAGGGAEQDLLVRTEFQPT
jgi:signal transduction histidine kinase